MRSRQPILRSRRSLRMTLVVLVLLAAVAPGEVVAQASQFGVRGLGIPGRPFSVRTLGTGGGFGLFDGESSLNPAALATLATITASFTGTQDFRTLENPAGEASTRDSRFPQFLIGGPLRRLPLTLGVSYSNYTNRDFSLSTSDTIELRGAPVEVTDTLSSRGGLSDLRLAAAYRLGKGWVLGAALHVITGSNRLQLRRTFDDETYLPTRLSSELGYSGVGASLGLTRQFGTNFAIAAVARADGHLDVEQDTTIIHTVDLPYTFGLGFYWRPAPKLNLGTHATVRTWSAANSDLLAQGGQGAKNTVDAALGAEYTPDARRPYRLPLRLGVHYGTLPFVLDPAARQAHELGVALGTGASFAAQRGGIDLALERVWRSGGSYSESAWIASVGVSVRP